MRKTLLLLTLFFGVASNAQNSVPPYINYQAVLRDASGLPIAAGTSVTLNVKIFNDGTVSVQAYEEDHSVVIPPTSIVNIRIGNGNSQIPFNNFSAIQWNLGQASYLVSLNGNPIGARSPFASVPYAFSSGGNSSSPSYSPSANISTAGNVLDLIPTSVTTGSYGGNSSTNSKVPSFIVDNNGRLTQAGDYNTNTGGDIAGKLDSQTVVKLRNYPLLNIPPSPGQVLQYNASGWSPATLTGSSSSNYTGTNGIVVLGTSPNFSIAPVTNATVGVWSTVGNSNTNGSNGFIGTTDNNPFIIRTGNSIRAFFNGLNGNLGLGTLNPAYKLHSVTTNGAVSIFGDNSSTANNPQAYGILGSSSSTSTLSAGLYGQSLGNGSGVVGTTSASASSAILGQNFAVISNSLAIGVHGKTQNTNQNAAGVYGENVGAGPGVIGTTSANIGAVIGVNLTNASASGANGVYGLSNSTHSVSAGVWGESRGAGNGVYGVNTNTTLSNVSGVYGTVVGGFGTNSGVFGEVDGSANGVKGVNKASGNSILGSKPVGATGFAGRFEINDNTNSSAALFAITQGAGAAMQASAGAPLTSALSLHMVNGHIKSSGNIVTNVALMTTASTGNFLTSGGPPSCNNCNDVRGEVTFFAHATALIASGDYAEVTIPFTKTYTNIPIVVATPRGDLLGLNYMINGVTNTGFRIRIYKPFGQSFPGTIASGTTFTFSYFVIE